MTRLTLTLLALCLLAPIGRLTPFSARAELIEFPSPPPALEPEYSCCVCPSCGVTQMEFVSTPCPEYRPGCLVLHYGYQCHSCGKLWFGGCEQVDTVKCPPSERKNANIIDTSTWTDSMLGTAPWLEDTLIITATPPSSGASVVVLIDSILAERNVACYRVDTVDLWYYWSHNNGGMKCQGHKCRDSNYRCSRRATIDTVIVPCGVQP